MNPDPPEYTPEELCALLDDLNPFLLAEAIASVRLSQDTDGQTCSLDEVTDE